MPPHPVSANNRVIFKYTVIGLQHKLQKYCEAISSADPSGFDLIGQNGLGAVGFSLVGDAIATAIAPFFKTGDVTFDACELWERSGTTFEFRATTAPTVGPSGTSRTVFAQQYGISGKNSANQPLNTYLYETGPSDPSKISSYATLGAADKALVDFFYNVGGGATNTSAWNWSQSRNIWAVDRWLAVIIDSNEKLRRVRGIK